MPRQSEPTLAAIKQAVDLIALVGEYLPLQRAGTKFKALCPFHNDHHPSLELNPERQSFKCWSCGAGGDVFDFVQKYERVEFPEALRMLADRAGVPLTTIEPERAVAVPVGPSKSELLAAAAWAEAQFAAALSRDDSAREYLLGRGLTLASIERFRLGSSPDQRDWLLGRGRRESVSVVALEQVGLIARNAETNLPRDRFRGRAIFPIHDLAGRTIGFGGRILPETEKAWNEKGQKVAKYVNTPETVLFHKRRTLYGADLARAAARQAGWVAVVEGYTDVIAAHQVGIENVVGTLGTALGDDHIATLRRLADRVVLVFDGDEAGQNAADRALEIFLSHEVDVRVLTLPSGVDPCEFLLSDGGATAFLGLVESAVDPLDFAISRAASKFDLESPEGTRQATEAVLNVLARVPVSHRAGLEVKVAKALDTLGRQLRVPVAELQRGLRQARRQGHRPERSVVAAVAEPAAPLRPGDFDPLERELVSLALNEPRVVAALRFRVPADTVQAAPLRQILHACYTVAALGREPSFEEVSLHLDDAPARELAAGLLLPIEPAPLSDGAGPAPAEARLAGLLARLSERERRQRLRDLHAAMSETDPLTDPAAHQALKREYFRVLSQRPDLRKTTATGPNP